jgi:hypothetical protein
LAVNPWPGFMVVILRLMVSATRRALSMPPRRHDQGDQGQAERGIERLARLRAGGVIAKVGRTAALTAGSGRPKVNA